MARMGWIFVAGVLSRFCLFLTNFHKIFQKRVEISTPLNSWLRVQEGLFLKGKEISPYAGDTYHETPITLVLAEYLGGLPDICLYLVFIICDVLTAIVLALAVEEARRFYLMRSQKESKYLSEAKQLEIQEDENYAQYVIMSYLLNPFCVMNCVGQTTTVFGNLTSAIAIFSMLKGAIKIFYIDRLLVVTGVAPGTRGLRLNRYRWACGISLAFAAYQSLYPISLIFPAVICIYHKDKEMSQQKGVCWKLSSVKTVVAFLVPLFGFLVLSKEICSGWNFLDQTYGFILNVRDLKPNIGLFWYFFTEMFEHFHLLFICTFQINAFIYVIPLTIRFFDEPSLLIYSFHVLLAIFKSYPSIGDVGFYLALLPMWKHLFPFMQQKFLVGCFFIATAVLAPIQWYLWIYSGSANANFYFGVTIAFGTAQIFLLTDVLLAFLKREYYLKHGMSKEIDGKPAGLNLR